MRTKTKLSVSRLRIIFTVAAILTGGAALMTFGCSGKSGQAGPDTSISFPELVNRAKAEGMVVSIGMPDSWANWKGTWDDLKSKYGLAHTDTDMSSAEEIAKFDAEKDKPSSDIGDIGIAFAATAVAKGVTLPYKTAYWNDIPVWAKDQEGHWMMGYTGTIAFMTNKKLVKNPPKTWADLLTGTYKVSVGDVGKAAQANNGVLACALAMGGDETNLKPALDFFAKLAKQGRLSMTNPVTASFEKGEVEVGVVWDFNALNYSSTLGKNDYAVCVPADGSVISGYTTIINKYAPHPYAAMLAREYSLSDEGQINLAVGFARPIRSNVKIPAAVKANMIPDEQYAKAVPVKDFTAWEKTSATLPQLWQENVLIHNK